MSLVGISDLIACARDFSSDPTAERIPCGGVARYVSLNGTPICSDCGSRWRGDPLVDIDSPQGHRIIARASASIEVPS